VENELLRLSQSWPVSTIDGEPSLTRGTLEVVTQRGGGLLLVISAGDEVWPDNSEIQFPLSTAQAALVARALGGEQLGSSMRKSDQSR
jgi:hypothetical protein